MRMILISVVLLAGCGADQPRPTDEEIHREGACDPGAYPFVTTSCELPCVRPHSVLNTDQAGASCTASHPGNVNPVYCRDFAAAGEPPSQFSYKGVNGCCDRPGLGDKVVFAVCEGE